MKPSKTWILIAVASFSPSPAVPWVKMWVMMVTKTNEMRVKKMPFFDLKLKLCIRFFIREGTIRVRFLLLLKPSHAPVPPFFDMRIPSYLCQTLNVTSYGPQSSNVVVLVTPKTTSVFAIRRPVFCFELVCSCGSMAG